MKALLIILGIIAFILILLMIPVRIKLDYGEKTTLRLGYFFLSFRIYPAKEKKPGKKKKTPEKKKEEEKKKPQKKKTGKLKQLLDKHGADGLIEILKEAAKIVTELLGGLARHLYFTRFNVRICVVGEDAADTAVKYGYVCSAVYLPIAVLSEHSVIKKHSEDISAGFLFEKTIVEFIFHSRIRPYWLVGMGISAVVKLLVSLVRAIGMKA